MNNQIDIVAYGDWALFTDSKTRQAGSKVSYPIPTMSALDGMLRSIYWHPEMQWEIESVEILNEIETENKNVLLQAKKYTSKQLGRNTYLRNVAYRIKASIIPSEFALLKKIDFNLNKYVSIVNRRVEKGSSGRPFFLGTSECSGYFMNYKDYCTYINNAKSFYIDNAAPHLNWMLLTIVYPSPDDKDDNLYKVFWKPEIENGVVRFPSHVGIKQLITSRKRNNSDKYLVESFKPGEYTLPETPSWQLDGGTKDV